MQWVRRHDQYCWQTGNGSEANTMNMSDTSLDVMAAAQREAARSSARSGDARALGVADWLSFAAAPTFLIMALLTGLGAGPQDMLCSVTQDVSPLSGMVPMYGLMSAFHLAPWLKLI